MVAGGGTCGWLLALVPRYHLKLVSVLDYTRIVGHLNPSDIAYNNKVDKLTALFSYKIWGSNDDNF